jgi:oligopeptide/dipeptide ABC transporter ATP-binding protein
VSLVKVDDLHKVFRVPGGYAYAVNGISFEIQPREAVALVGESGCGKSTTARCLVRLEEPSQGRIYFKEKEITRLREGQFRPYRQRLQMVFQDPSTSLNPSMTVRQTLAEPLQLHKIVSNRADLEEKLIELISLVQLEPEHLDRAPRQLSGGQKQRVGIARAIASNPDVVLLDEPTSSLDMSVRISIIQLLKQLQQELGMAYLFISHDLSTVRYLCNRVLVMYLGRIVEAGPVAEIFDHPAHSYTEALLSAIPIPDPDVRRQRIILRGETPSLTRMVTGCPLQDRCDSPGGRCKNEEPHLVPIGDEHYVACWAAVERSKLQPSGTTPQP